MLLIVPASPDSQRTFYDTVSWTVNLLELNCVVSVVSIELEITLPKTNIAIENPPF